MTQRKNKIKKVELEALHQFLSFTEEKSLANDVAKLYSGDEKNGLGEFLYESLDWNNTKSQLSGQLGVIFTLSKAWKHNGTKINMKFLKLSKNWLPLLKEYYNSARNKVSQSFIENNIKEFFFRKD